MRTFGIGVGLMAVTATLAVATPASAEFFGCNDNAKGKVLASYTGTAPKARSMSFRTGTRHTHELSAQSTRPSITIYPRTSRPGPNSKRHCRSWLDREYRVSGTVIVPRMQCWWE